MAQDGNGTCFDRGGVNRPMRLFSAQDPTFYHPLSPMRVEGNCDTVMAPNELYRELQEHLDRHYCVVHDDETCLIYDLREMPSEDRQGDGSKLKG
jgi:hypothetical protein